MHIQLYHIQNIGLFRTQGTFLTLVSVYVGQGSTIWFVGSWISFLGSLLFFWLFVWADGINKCGWCLAGGRGCWLKGPHQIASVSWIFHHWLEGGVSRGQGVGIISWFIFLLVLLSFVLSCPLSLFLKWLEDHSCCVCFCLYYVFFVFSPFS